MDPNAGAVPTSAEDLYTPLYLENVAHNTKSLHYIKSTFASIAGAAAGVLGLTNLRGFAFYLISSLFVAASIATMKGDWGKVGKYVKNQREVWIGGAVDNVFSFVLWWTLFYALVHIFD